MTVKVSVKPRPIWDERTEKYIDGFQADIDTGLSDHHGLAFTEDEALLNAALHWHKYVRVQSGK